MRTIALHESRKGSKVDAKNGAKNSIILDAKELYTFAV